LNLSDGRGMRGGIAAKYNLRGIPHYVLISPEGKIIDIWGGYGEGSLLNRLKSLNL